MSSPTSSRRLSASTFAILLALAAAAACDSDSDEPAPPFSEACDQCLSREACSIAWEACIAEPDCREAVLCALRAECYTEPPESTCVSDAGCELPRSASEEVHRLAEEFELCARVECGRTCSFVEP